MLICIYKISKSMEKVHFQKLKFNKIIYLAKAITFYLHSFQSITSTKFNKRLAIYYCI